MNKNIYISLLLSFYGPVLTEKQYNMLDSHYNQDLSFGEIAEQQGISRQGVNDAIRKGEAILDDLENKLKYADKYMQSNKIIKECLDILKDNDKGEEYIISLQNKLNNLTEILED